MLSHHRHRDEPAVVEVETASGKPALVVGSAIGAAGIVVGFYALARVGVDTDDFGRPTATVLGIEHTPVLALSEVGFGAVMVLAAMTTRLGRIAIGLLSATLAAFGAALLSAAPTSRLHHWFGVVHHQGWSFVVVGAIGLLATLSFPTITRRTIGPLTPAADTEARAPQVAAPNDPKPAASKSNVVHYVTPFGSSAWLPDWQAETFLQEDEQRWSRLQELEMVSVAQRTVGPPHIEQPTPDTWRG